MMSHEFLTDFQTTISHGFSDDISRISETPDMSDLSQLVQLAEQSRPTQVSTQQKEVPKLNRNLNQLKDAAQNLLNKHADPKSTTMPKENINLQAVKILGMAGLELPNVAQSIAPLEATTKFEKIPVEEQDIDLESFLRDEFQNILIATIDESRRSVQERCENHLWGQVDQNWEQEKEGILTGLVEPGQTLSAQYKDDTGYIVGGTVIPVAAKYAMSPLELTYATQLYNYNAANIKGMKTDLIENLLVTATSLDDSVFRDIWEQIRIQTENTNSSLEPTSKQKSQLSNSLKYLEGRYKEFMSRTVDTHQALAYRQGVPGTIYLIISYLNVIFSPGGINIQFEDGDIMTKPVWAVLYHALRSGSLANCLSSIPADMSSMQPFIGYLQEYANNNGCLSFTTENQLRGHYRKLLPSIKDPYKRGVLCILARCDVATEHPVLARKTEDWIWIKLSQCKCEENNTTTTTTTTTDKLTLNQLQFELVNKYGEKHFSEKPLLFFQVLMLSLQYEQAIGFLWRTEAYRSHAIHIAIALNEIKLVQLTNTVRAPYFVAVDSPTGNCQINLVRMIQTYTTKFTSTNPTDAIQYYYILRGVTEDNNDLFIVSVSEMIADSKEYQVLLGCIDSDGIRKPGLLDRLKIDSVPEITERVGLILETRGLTLEAAKVYELSANHRKVLEIINLLLSNLITQNIHRSLERSQVTEFAFNFAECIKSHGHRATKPLAATFYLLLDLLQFHDQFKSGNISTAMQIIEQLGILPLRAPETPEVCVTKFNNQSEEIRQCMSDIILASMVCIHTLYKQKQDSLSQPPYVSNQGLITQLQEEIALFQQKARKLVIYAGMLPYRLTGDTNTKIVQLEMLMT